MYLRKATELAHWSMPWNNFIAMEKGFNKALGAQLNDVVYYSKPLSWKTVITTPNNTTLYVMSFWNIETSGSMVVEIPATTNTVGGNQKNNLIYFFTTATKYNIAKSLIKRSLNLSLVEIVLSFDKTVSK